MTDLKNKNKIVFFITITIILDTAGFGIIFPVLPSLLEKLLKADISEAAKYAGVLAFAYALMQFIFAPILGSLSDRFGRKPVLLISLLGFSLDCLLMLLARTYWILVVGRCIAGITGATFAVCSATMADITDGANRTRYYGFINAAFGVGFVIGPLIGGMLGEYNSYYPFLLSGILGICTTIYGYLFFPETQKPKTVRPFRLSDIESPLVPIRSVVRLKDIGILFLCYFLVSVSSHSMESTWAYFTIAKFEWSKQQIGLSLAIIGVVGFLVQIYLVRFLSKILPDIKLILVGLFISGLGLLLLSFASTPIHLWIGITLYLIGSIQQTGFQSFLSKSVDQENQGKLQGILGSINGLTTILAPLMFTYSFYVFTNEKNSVHFAGIAFLIAALFITTGFLILLIRYKRQTLG